MLRQLLGMISCGAPLQDESRGADDHAQVPDTVAQAALDEGLEALFPQADRLRDHLERHDSIHKPIATKPPWPMHPRASPAEWRRKISVHYGASTDLTRERRDRQDRGVRPNPRCYRRGSGLRPRHP